MGERWAVLGIVVLCAGCPRVHVNIPPEECVGQSCNEGCAEGEVVCGDDGCVNLSSDTHHCGDCDVKCPPKYYCVLGDCTLGCPEPLLLCDAGSDYVACVDSSRDPVNCGGCSTDDPAHVCLATPAAGTTPVCNAGACSWECKPGLLDCGDVLPPASGESTCLPRDADNCNCGTCGTKCASWSHSGTTCSSSGLRTSTCCGGACIALNTDVSCGSTCEDVKSCGVGSTCCAQDNIFGCVDTQHDPNNCSTCGYNCDYACGSPPGYTMCSYGNCYCL